MTSKIPSPDAKRNLFLDLSYSLKDIPSDRILEHDLKELRPIARRSIESLLRRRACTKKFALYNYEINKLILHEMWNDEPERGIKNATK